MEIAFISFMVIAGAWATGHVSQRECKQYETLVDHTFYKVYGTSPETIYDWHQECFIMISDETLPKDNPMVSEACHVAVGTKECQ